MIRFYSQHKTALRDVVNSILYEDYKDLVHTIGDIIKHKNQRYLVCMITKDDFYTKVYLYTITNQMTDECMKLITNMYLADRDYFEFGKEKYVDQGFEPFNTYLHKLYNYHERALISYADQFQIELLR